MIRILDTSPSDYEAVLRLNAAAVPHVSLISQETLRDLHRQAFYFRVGRSDEETCGFLLALTQEATYDSLN